MVGILNIRGAVTLMGTPDPRGICHGDTCCRMETPDVRGHTDGDLSESIRPLWVK